MTSFGFCVIGKVIGNLFSILISSGDLWEGLPEDSGNACVEAGIP